MQLWRTGKKGTVIARRDLLRAMALLGGYPALGGDSQARAVTNPQDDREYWVRLLTRISHPVLQALSERKLRATMPVEAPHGNAAERRKFTYLEAMGRLLAGIAPWIESGSNVGDEGRLRNQYADLARASIQAGVDPQSPDFMNFNRGSQPVVDAAFLALAILRAPVELWQKLDGPTKQSLVRALQSTRVIRPGYNNWLLFSATVEAALSIMGVWWDPMRVDYAVRAINSWYKGDGVYGDGPDFHFDYYNSFVIHPMLLMVLDVISRASHTWEPFRPAALARARRYAAIQERLIAPDGSFPAVGRSLAYRFGAFHLLADISLRRQLPENVAPAQVRCALSAVMRRMIEAPGTFDARGWLTVGFCGHQPSIAEGYISTGSCYLCSAAWLPLGLPANDPFWAGPAEQWTAQKAWSGGAVKADHALTAFRPSDGRLPQG